MKNIGSTEARIVGIAQKMCSGEVDLVEGARQLVGLSAHLDERNDELFAPIVAVESETDDLPLGEARSCWSEEALRNKDAEVATYLREVRAEVLRACEALVHQYSKKSF